MRGTGICQRVRASTRSALEQAEHVSLNISAARDLASVVSRIVKRRWWSDSPVGLDDLSTNELVGFLLTFNAISFSYWGCPRWTVNVGGLEYDGTWAMVISLGRRLAEQPGFFEPRRLATLTKREAEEMFRDHCEIPLLNERVAHLQDVGTVVRDKFSSNYSLLVESSEFQAEHLVAIIVGSIKTFDDRGEFVETTVEFHKRAQLFVADLDYHLRTKGCEGLDGVEDLTACADYKLPQVLRHAGVLKYSPELSERVDQRIPIPAGSIYEVEIRAATIQAVELIKQEVALIGASICAIEINDFLWLWSQNPPCGIKPYHLTRTTAY